MKRVILIALFLLYGGNAYACSCARVVPAEERIERSEYIFLAEVADITPTDDGSSLIGHTEFEIKLSVIESWKGSVGAEVYVPMHHISGSSCGAPFKLGYHVVVLVDNLNQPEFGSCKHNAWTLAEDEIEEVREFVASELRASTSPH